MSALDIPAIRSRFPALRREHNGGPVAYFDGPGGTQVPTDVIEAMARVLSDGVSNLGTRFATARYASEITQEARAAMADFFGSKPDEVVFGQNMTSLTFAMSRALSRTWQPGDEIVVTDLDHDANRSPWVLAARDRGVTVRVAHFDPATGTLDPRAVAGVINPRTRLVAVTYASNALGTIVDVAAIAALARAANAVSYVDAVHFAPHGPIDVREIGCDFLVASAYKFFGPHTGCLIGRADLLASLESYKVVPAPTDGPAKWETGTQSFESLAGVTAAVDYLASLGSGTARRARLVNAMGAIQIYEAELSERFLAGIGQLDHIRLYGPPAGRRAPTFAIEVAGISAADVARRLGELGMFVWDGHYYAVTVMNVLGKEPGGLVRIGFTHYTTIDEVDRLLEALAGLRQSY